MTISRRGAFKTLAAAVPAFRLKPEATRSKEASRSKKRSPTLPTGGCTNATLTFAALVLRSESHRELMTQG